MPQRWLGSRYWQWAGYTFRTLVFANEVVNNKFNFIVNRG